MNKDNIRDKIITFRCNNKDKEVIEHLKEQQGIKYTSELIRSCIYTCYYDTMEAIQ